MWKNWNLHTFMVEMYIDEIHNDAASLAKLNIGFLYDPAILILGIYPKGLKIGTQLHVCAYS